MLTTPPLETLKSRLKQAVSLIHSQSNDPFGDSAAVEAAAKQAEKVFEEYSKTKPSAEDAYAAALAYMRGHTLSSRQYFQVSSALCMPLKEQRNTRLIGHPRLTDLLSHYGQEAARGRLRRLTWYGLMISYFHFPVAEATEAEKKGWQSLREVLKRTWPSIEKGLGSGPWPNWARVIQRSPDLLSDRAARQYGLDYLTGNKAPIEKLVSDLGIPQKSWFHNQVVLEAINAATDAGDLEFKQYLPHLISLAGTLPVFRDEAIEHLLNRCYKCSDKCSEENSHRLLRDFVVDKNVWRNPKLKDAGLATAWNRVSDEVWRMVLDWVNKANLIDFFDILAALNNADQGRLAFWFKYIGQIGWTRLSFGSHTLQLAHRNPKIRKLILREEGLYATMTANQGVDAFMMRIGNYIVVEFTKTPNAAYVYPANKLPFEPYAQTYEGGTSDLKHGFLKTNAPALRITHKPGWETDTELELKRLGIYPDTPKAQGTGISAQPSSAPRPSSTIAKRPERAATSAPKNAHFTMTELHNCVHDFGARIVDSRTTGGGRLWVEDPNQGVVLARTLQALGFRWAEKRQAWFFPEQ